MRALWIVPMLSVTASCTSHGVLYPKDHLARFVVDNLDVTSLNHRYPPLFDQPPPIDPRKKRRDRAFRDFGFFPSKITDDEAIMDGIDGRWRFAIQVLHRSDSGISVCITNTWRDSGSYKDSLPLLLTRSDSTSLLDVQPGNFDCP